MRSRDARYLIAIILVSTWGCLSGACDAQTPEERWRERWGADAAEKGPRVVETRRGYPGWVELEDLYLGQPGDEARRALRRYCGDNVVERQPGRSGGEATFLGCRVEEEPFTFVRVGFWPKLQGRVAILELKRPSVTPPAIHAQFEDWIGDRSVEQKRIRSHLVLFDTDHYRLYADWDDGFDAPAHLVIGFVPGLERLPESS